MRGCLGGAGWKVVEVVLPIASEHQRAGADFLGWQPTAFHFAKDGRAGQAGYFDKIGDV